MITFRSWAEINKDIEDYAYKKLEQAYGSRRFEIDTEQHEFWLEAFAQKSLELGNKRDTGDSCKTPRAA